MKKDKPDNTEDWISEIINAYKDALETIPFGHIAGTSIKEGDLFHLAPSICLKFRGIKRTKKKLQTATEAALSSYIATEGNEDEIFSNAFIAFSFAYLASHFGLNLVAEEEIINLMEYIEANIEDISLRL